MTTNSQSKTRKEEELFSGRQRAQRRVICPGVPAMVLLLGALSQGVTATEVYWDGSHGQFWGGRKNWQLSNGAELPNPIDSDRDFVFHAPAVTGDQTIYLFNDNTSGGLRTIDSLTFESPVRTTIFSDPGNNNGSRLNMSEGAGNTDLLIRNNAGRVNLESEVRITRQNNWIHRGLEELNVNGLLRFNDFGSLHLNITQSNGGRVTFRGGISGSGHIIKEGDGRLTLSGNNRSTYSGDIFVNDGKLRITSAESLGAGKVTVDGATFLVNNAINIISNPFEFRNTGGVSNLLNVGGNNVTISGAVSGQGQWEKSGSGTLRLLGPNSSSGQLIIGNGVVEGTPKSLSRLIQVNEFSVVDFQAGGTYAGSVRGGGHMVKSGSGNLRLTGSNQVGSYAIIESGSLQFGSANLSANIYVAPTASAVLDGQYNIRRRFEGEGQVNGHLLVSGSGFLDGALTIAGSVVNRGGYNTLLNEQASTISGNYEQTSSGFLQTTLDPARRNALVVGGEAKLGGTLYLDASTIAGSYTPGDHYPVLISSGLDFSHLFDEIAVENFSGASSITYLSAPGFGSVTWSPELPLAFRSNPADANNNGLLDQEDLEAFAFAMFNPGSSVSFDSGQTILESLDYFDLVDRDAGVIDFDDLAALAEVITVETGSLEVSRAMIDSAIAAVKPVPEPNSLLVAVFATLMSALSKRRIETALR